MTEGFGLANLPLGIFSTSDSPPRAGAAYGDSVIDLRATLGDAVFESTSLNAFLSQGHGAWADARQRLRAAVESGATSTVPRADAVLHLPIDVADFVDFFSSLEHATNAGNILRPANPGLPAAWRHLPIGYHGRAGTVVVSGTPVRRPSGQVVGETEEVVFRPTNKLDVEVELGYVVGAGSHLGVPVSADEFERHVFGAVILIDWSARDIQAFEYQPLGPFLAKSFATTISPWIVPLEALRSARVAAPARDPEPLPHLRETESWSLDVRFELEIDGEVLTRPRLATMYWTGAQQLAHMTSNGASLRTGDLYGTGTVTTGDDYGSLLEITRNGETGTYLADGAHVVVRAWATTADGEQLSFGEAAATIEGAR